MRRWHAGKLLAIFIASMVCVSACGTKDAIETNKVTGISIETALDSTYSEVVSKLNNVDIIVKEDDALGTWSYDYEWDGNAVQTWLQFWNCEDYEDMNEDTPKEDLTLVSYRSEWEWENEEYTEDVQEYIRSIYSYYEKLYGKARSPENFDSEKLLNCTAYWMTSEDYDSPNLWMTFLKDDTGAHLSIRHAGANVMKYQEQQKNL